MKNVKRNLLVAVIVLGLVVAAGLVSAAVVPTNVEAEEWCETTYIPLGAGFCWGPASNCAGTLPRCPEI